MTENKLYSYKCVDCGHGYCDEYPPRNIVIKANIIARDDGVIHIKSDGCPNCHIWTCALDENGVPTGTWKNIGAKGDGTGCAGRYMKDNDGS